ncbi:MAG: ferric reductase-like transmembrane domain-containing protein [Candidatus Diapherotrites archaeon]|nr:ferric reductase-like transmembrane domain-containing protein [Candidatus Diapherotrites archaeon]
MARLFEGALKNWKFVLKFLVFSVVFWLLEFAYQFYVLEPENFPSALIRSFAFSGATFIGLALLSSVLFKFKPVYAKYWHVRRSLGVTGFVFIIGHALSVTLFVFKGDVSQVFFSLNPIENPMIFGVIGYMVFLVMALTSTDWAMQKIGAARWKTIHRLVYFGYFAAVFHFLTINQPALFNLAGYLLLAVTFLVLAGELYWFVKIAGKNKFSTLGAKIGFLLILLYLVFAYLVFFAK